MAAAVVLVSTAMIGLSVAVPGQVAVRGAWTAYANTTRDQVPETAAGVEAVRAKAQSDAARAASADARWKPLQNDIQDAYSLIRMGAATDNEELAAYFAADRRVQADCKAAGRDIGDLVP